MLTDTIDSIRTENAKFARDVEYLRETAKDDVIDNCVENAESQYVRESIDELEEASYMVNRLSPDVNVVEESAEIDRILNAEENITFEEMIGV